MRYADGIEVMPGDEVLVPGRQERLSGRILYVVAAGTREASTWSLPDGGCVIEGGGLGLFTVASIESDREIQFVRRQYP
jgi:hypothetical protein